MLIVGKTSVDDLSVEDASRIEYHEIPEDQLWRVDIVNQLIDALWGECKVEGFSRDELTYMLGYASCTWSNFSFFLKNSTISQSKPYLYYKIWVWINVIIIITLEYKNYIHESNAMKYDNKSVADNQ